MLRRLAVLMTTAALAVPLLAIGLPATPAGAYDKNTMTVVARDYTFVVDGTLRPGQARVVFKNTGKEVHMLAILKLRPGVALKQVRKALTSNDNNAFDKITPDPQPAFGTPSLLTPGGYAASITELMTAGDYVMICFVDDAKGKPHFAHGMIQKFTVTGKKSKSHTVDSDGTVVVDDTSIRVPPGPAPSTATIEIDNQGSALHSFVIVKLNGSSTVPELDAYFNKTFVGGPWPADAPGEVLSGVGAIPAGDHVYLQWKDLPPGRYGYASTSGDSESPEGDDISRGLYGEFTVA